MKCVYISMTIFALLSGSNAFAKQAPVDIHCMPSVVMDAGYEVIAVQTSDKTYEIEVFELHGWRDNTLEFKGSVHLLSEKVGTVCRYKLVDDINVPKTVVSLRPHGGTALESLNGTKLIQTGRSDVDDLSLLKCEVSQRFKKDLPPCQK